jgi:putative spermidine/putrescine transport system ATP-binding protein
MLRIIAGLELPDAGGRVLFDGNDMTSVPIERRNVGMVFQSYALFPNMSVADNIGYGLKIRGIGKQERASRVAELGSSHRHFISTAGFRGKGLAAS